MMFRMLGRSFMAKNLLGWVAVGAAAFLAVPAVRRVLRSAAANAASGAMTLGEGVRRFGVRKKGGSVQTYSENVRTDGNAAQTHDQWQAPRLLERPRLRQAVVRGIASTMNAAEGVVEGTKGLVRKARTASSTEIGQIGADTGNAGGSLLPGYLLPQAAGSRTRGQHPQHGASGDFAVKNDLDLPHFTHAADHHVGVDFKPDYRNFVDMVKHDAD
ncbi:MAG: hypothetical protein ACYCVB_03065 [Bacilli bacterium]